MKFIKIVLVIFLVSANLIQGMEHKNKPGKGPKKGICLTTKSDQWYKKVESLNVSWHYSWGDQLKPEEPDGVEFVPMIWSAHADTSAVDQKLQNISSLYADKKIRYMLGFNEPDGKKQANMSVGSALDYWPRLQKLNIPLGSPACVHPDNEWMKGFMQKADSLNYRVDFICVHWYGGPNAKAFLSYLEKVYNLYHKPIWITEFAVADWKAKTAEENKFSKAVILDFMKEILPALDKTPYVERYAWFSANENSAALGNAALFDANGNLTELGKYYKSF